MTQSVFDPACFGTYPASNPPKFLHFEYEGSSDIHRYMLVDRFHVNDISPVTKRCVNEPDDDGLQHKYVHPLPAREVEVLPKAVKTELEGLRKQVAELTEQLAEIPLTEVDEPEEVVEEPVGDQSDGPATEVATDANEPAAPITELGPNAEATTEQPEAPTD